MRRFFLQPILVIIVILLGVMISAYFLLENNHRELSAVRPNVEATNNVGDQSLPDTARNRALPALEISLSAGDDKKQTWSPMGDEASKAKVMAWFAARGNYGFYGPDMQDDYKNYDSETLQKLSETGDVRAMHILSDRAGSLDESRKILHRAAVFGSTEALTQMGTIEQINNGIREMNPEERKEIIMESLSYYEAAEIRGDWWPKIQNHESLLERFSVELSQQEKDRVVRRGKEIYDELQENRYKLGLGNFDNSVPDEVIKFYEEMVKPL